MRVTQRITITLPDGLARELRRKAKRTKKPVSRLVKEAIEQQHLEEIRQRMIEGYKAMAEENLRLAEEWLPLTVEVLPDD